MHMVVPYCLIYAVHDRVLWRWKKSIMRTWRFYMFSAPMNMNTWCFECRISVCLSVRPSVQPSIHPSIHPPTYLPTYLSVCTYVQIWTKACLAGAWTVGRTLFILGIQEFMHPRSVPGESGDSTSKNCCPLDGLRNRNRRFSRKRLKRLWINLSNLCRSSR
jgi:hypothetical protein